MINLRGSNTNNFLISDSWKTIKHKIFLTRWKTVKVLDWEHSLIELKLKSSHVNFVIKNRRNLELVITHPDWLIQRYDTQWRGNQTGDYCEKIIKICIEWDIYPLSRTTKGYYLNFFCVCLHNLNKLISRKITFKVSSKESWQINVNKS